MLNHREVLEALLAGETLVDVADSGITIRFNGTNILDQESEEQETICLFDWKIKPRTITINGYEVPEPMRVKPSLGDKFYITFLTNNTIESYFFSDSSTENRWFKLGFLHKTREAAELHLEALLSFTKHE
jgi:hypothetical protein